MDPKTLKLMFRDLVAACGGTMRAADKLSYPAPHISDAMAPHREDRWPRLDHVMLLEADCGQPLVTKYLADASGFDLVARGGERAQASVHQHFSRITREASDVTVALAEAMADGQITSAERQVLRREALELQDRLLAFLADLDAPQPKIKAVR